MGLTDAFRKEESNHDLHDLATAFMQDMHELCFDDKRQPWQTEFGPCY